MDNELDKANRQYIQEKVHPVFEKLLMDMIMEKPDDVIQFIKKWVNEQSNPSNLMMNEVEIERVNKQQKKSIVSQSNSYNSEQDEDEEEDQFNEQELSQLIQKNKNKQRQSVCAEVYGAFNVKQKFVPVKIEKSEEQIKSIRSKLEKSFIFNACEEKDIQIVIECMEIKEYQANEIVIKQGENGDYFYIIDIGELDCYKQFEKNKQPVHLKIYQAGESFGELALLYNATRAATIKTSSICRLFLLNRECFNNIVKEAAMKKRERYEGFLEKVDLLQSISSYEKMQLADALKIRDCYEGEEVVREGQEGNEFYFIEEGLLHAIKQDAKGNQVKVYEFNKGDYFGELALIKNQPRAATIISVTNSRVVYVDRDSFNRLLGPIEHILSRNQMRYHNHNQ